MAEGRLFLQSILLGAAGAVGYDLLRPFRIRFRRIAAVLDVLFALGVGTAAFAFLLRRAEGELRWFLVVGAAGGAAVYGALCGEILRPVWQFWADVLIEWVRLGLLPIRATVRGVKNFLRRGKNLFYFARKCYTIKKIGTIICMARKNHGSL